MARLFGDGSNTVTATVKLGAASIAVDPRTDTIYVMGPEGSTSALDGRTDTVITTTAPAAPVFPPPGGPDPGVGHALGLPPPAAARVPVWLPQPPGLPRSQGRASRLRARSRSRPGRAGRRRGLLGRVLVSDPPSRTHARRRAECRPARRPALSARRRRGPPGQCPRRQPAGPHPCRLGPPAPRRRRGSRARRYPRQAGAVRATGSGARGGRRRGR